MSAQEKDQPAAHALAGVVGAVGHGGAGVLAEHETQDVESLHAQGEVDQTVNHEAIYAEGAPVTFEPDEPGFYEIKIAIVTRGADLVTGEVNARAEHIMTLVVDGSSGGGCSVGFSGNSAPLWLLLAALVLPLARRRRRR